MNRRGETESLHLGERRMEETNKEEQKAYTYTKGAQKKRRKRKLTPRKRKNGRKEEEQKSYTLEWE